MAISYVLGTQPIWFFVDKTGLSLGGGYLATYSALQPGTLLTVFQDPAGQFPWPYTNIPNTSLQGIQIDANGTLGPLFFQTDPTNKNIAYFLQWYDPLGNLIDGVDNYVPPSGGGSTPVTETNFINQLIINPTLYRNVGNVSPITSAIFKVADGPHSGFANNATNTTIYTGPNIHFVKNNTSATDALTFSYFTLGSQLNTGVNADETPEFYCTYACTAAGSGETIKCIQFPITRGVQNLSNMTVSGTIWAKCTAGNTTLTLYFYQFFGDGTGASVVAPVSIQAFTLTSTFSQYSWTATVPNVSGKTLGGNSNPGICGNDALFLQVGFPLNATTTISFTKPTAYLGTTAPVTYYETYDQYDSILNAPRTGHIVPGYDLAAPFGYLLMDDLTIGSSSSGATSNGGRGANVNTFPLYNLLWNNVSSPSSNALCPITGGIGASAVADYTAGKTMTLQAMLGRALCSAGAGSLLTSRTLGSNTGNETHTLSITEMPPHNHGIFGSQTSGGSPFYPVMLGNIRGQQGPNDSIANTGGSSGMTVPFNIMQPSSFMNFYIKL